MEQGLLFNQDTLSGLVREIGAPAMPRLLASLCAEIRTSVENFDRYFSDQDWHALEVEAHALKSATLSFGAEGVSDACRAIEYGIKENTSRDVIRGYISLYKTRARETIDILEGQAASYSEALKA